MKSQLHNRFFYFMAIFFSLGAGIVGTAQAIGTPSICDEIFSGKANGLCTAYCEATGCNTSDPNVSSRVCSKLLSKFTRAGVDQGITTDEFNYVTCTAAVACPCAPILNAAGATFSDHSDSPTLKRVVIESNDSCENNSILNIFFINNSYICASSINIGQGCARWTNDSAGMSIEQANACVNVLQQVSGFTFTPFQ